MLNKITSTPKRSVRTAVRAIAVAVAVAAVSVTGTLSAGAATSASKSKPGVPSGAVRVKEVKSASGVLDVYKIPSTTTVKPFGTINHCTTSGNAQLEVCFGIAGGGGTNVQFMQNWSQFALPGTVNMQINGPGGVITETGNFYQYGHNSPQDNGTYVSFWYPNNQYAPAGYYCATSFTYTTRQGTCLTVNS